MTNYAKGVRLERRTIRVLKAAGYEAHRTAGSHGPYDVVAHNTTGFRLIQSKASGWGTPLEREALSLLPVPSNCSLEVWRWDDRAREPRILVVRHGGYVELLVGS